MDLKNYFHLWKKDLVSHRKDIFLSLIFLLIAILFHYISGNFVMNNPDTVVVPDLLLSRLPYIGLPLVHVYLFIFTVFIFFTYPLFFRTNKLHLAIAYFSLFTMVRSIFICLTHLQTPSIQSPVLYFPKILQPFAFQNDLFFSGHTGLPFLGFLLYFDRKFLRYFFLLMSIILGTLVLLMRLHYSIDVLAAFFITYGVFKISQKIFEGKDLP